MPIYLDDFIKILAEICEEKNLKTTVSQSLKGGLATGIAAVIGGLLLGPVGLAVGGALGGGVSAISARNKFQSVALVLLKLTDSQKQRLYKKVQYAFRDFGPEDAFALSTLIMSQVAFKEMAVGIIKNYLTNELHIQIQE